MRNGVLRIVASRSVFWIIRTETSGCARDVRVCERLMRINFTRSEPFFLAPLFVQLARRAQGES